ncbi:hypothetical protein MchiMG62_14080 [Methanoculleus chikugoensis]|uniref:Uncharacterized protein n=1 Tax=Methanoculleus chikugoensis TaxID=118126 RepID=A0ABN5XI70_9EURY|nr:hypothetical protein MchiMG62_14080 [Methanoculleus chikugoensis]
MSTVRCEDGDIEHRGPGEEDAGEGRDERDLPAEAPAGDDLEDDEDERDADDREPEERPERLLHPVGVETGVLLGTNVGSKTSGSLKRVLSR